MGLLIVYDAHLHAGDNENRTLLQLTINNYNYGYCVARK